MEIPDSEHTLTEADNKYIIQIDNFNGPLDLLWELIKKAKIDITDISISHITEQYIAYLKLMKDLNVKVASEFIWMASELLYYKSKALLPVDEMGDEYFVPPLPPELVQKLLEYKKYQKTSQDLNRLFDRQDNFFIRNSDVKDLLGQEEYIDVSLFDLLKAFADVIESQRIIEHEEILFDEILVSDRIEYIIELLKEDDVVRFTDIFTETTTKAEIIATFLAILEMAKTKVVRLMQHMVFGDIRIARNFSLENLPTNNTDDYV